MDYLNTNTNQYKSIKYKSIQIRGRRPMKGYLRSAGGLARPQTETGLAREASRGFP